MVAKDYSEEQRRNALALYKEHGPSKASRQCGIPQKTISSWAKRGGVQSDAPQKTKAAVEAARLKWAERRTDEANEAGHDAQSVRLMMLALAMDEQTKKAQELATVYGVLIDKAQLLSGSATSRTEDVTRDVFEAYLKGAADTKASLEHDRANK